MSVVSRWKDLGEAREAEDPVWRAHVREGSVRGKGGRMVGEVNY